MRNASLAMAGALLWLCWTGFVLSVDPSRKIEQPADPDHAAKMARGLDIFKKSVRPVLAKHCLRCHGGEVTESEFDLTDRDRLLKGGNAGSAVVSGDAQKSLLFQLVNHSKKPRMPHKEPKLAAEAINAIAAWIDNGAPFDKPLVDRGDSAAWTKIRVPDEAKSLWSLQPLKPVEPPRGTGAWGRTPVDQFVLAKLQAAGIEPNPLVDRRKLIRRAYFDLVGLPPPPEAVESFLRDTSPDAFEKVIDELLNSQHYGERWARHWLDVTRFAESHGFEHDYDRPSAYHYRDFVIKALNDGLPFDTFVKWQLAGDELAPNDNLALTATGFLAAGVHSTQITKNEVEKHRYDELDDMLATTGTAMLGLTVGCARCHDHKFDPIPQRDYYQMLSAFTTTVRSDIDLDLDPAGYKKAKAAFDQEHEPLVAARTKFESEQLPARLAAWEKTPGVLDKFPWIILDQIDARAGQGVVFKKLDDGSLLATGAKPQHDTYTLSALVFADKITAIRLEALSDPSLTKGGPGRADNGNFALSQLTVTSTPLLPFAGLTALPVPLKLANPRATFEQKGLPIAAAIDGKGNTGWAVDPQFGKDHAAAFEVALPEGHAPSFGQLLTFKLEFKNNDRHAIGRLRVSVTTAQAPVALQAPGLPEQLRSIVATPSKRSAAETANLLAWYRTQDSEWQQLDRIVQDHAKKAPKPNIAKALISSEGLAPLRLHTQGDDFLKETHFLRRGDPLQKEGVAPLGFLQILMRAPDQEKHWPVQPPGGSRTSFRRKAFADWLTDVDQGAGHLLARVIVNRLWQHHLGRGLVATPNDFGTRGEKPTHPELLDWLAGELIRNDWKLKPIHKLIMSSAVYQQSSQIDPAKAAKDPDNRLLWRRPTRRLEGEVIRDAMLALGGQLDPKMYGPGTLDEASKRRSIYFTVKRSKLLPMMVVFDAPEALSSIGDRPTTTIAPQALLLMNNAQVRGYARGLAKRLTSKPDEPIEAAIGLGYRLVLCRDVAAEELRESAAFVQQQLDSYHATGKAEAREMALADFCQVLMCLNEFVYVE